MNINKYTLKDNIVFVSANPKRMLRIGDKLNGGLAGKEVQFTINRFEWRTYTNHHRSLQVILSYSKRFKDGRKIKCSKQCGIGACLRLKYGKEKKVEKIDEKDY